MGAAARRRLVFHPSATVDEAVLRCETDVFGHYYGNTPAELDEAYGPYREQMDAILARLDELARHINSNAT